nr:terminase small subunit [Pseudomonas asiatica]
MNATQAAIRAGYSKDSCFHRAGEPENLRLKRLSGRPRRSAQNERR